eukprot:m.115977 g.115977  ORF g.115977 m.115977 type:complete len:116 (+) comp10898_c1_seq1:134-481(+)
MCLRSHHGSVWCWLRLQRLHGLYSAAPSLTWSGNAIEGLGNLEQFLAALPPSKHTVDVVEVQPSAAVAGVDILLLCCKGSVTYGSDAAVAFSDSMVLIPSETGGWLIQNECYRLH